MCVSATDRDEDDYSDSDVANFVMKIAATTHFLVDDYDPCEPAQVYIHDSTGIRHQPRMDCVQPFRCGTAADSYTKRG